jgi:hypothetical protein
LIRGRENARPADSARQVSRWRSDPVVASTGLGGYRVGVTEDQLKGAPKFGQYENWDWSNRMNDERVHGYYNTPLWY